MDGSSFIVSRKQIILIIASIVCIAVLYLSNSSRISPLRSGRSDNVRIVHVTGAIAMPGVYAIAGRMTRKHFLEKVTVNDYADLTNIDLDGFIVDGEYLPVPRSYNNADADEETTEISVQKHINITTATPDELQLLPGIGPVLAERIIQYRLEKPFVNTEDIMNVPGIGKKKYAIIKELIET